MSDEGVARMGGIMELRERAPGAAGRYLPAPGIVPPLDPGFRPAPLARRAMAAAVAASCRSVHVSIAVEQPGGTVSTC